jgi:hypothetical protein
MQLRVAVRASGNEQVMETMEAVSVNFGMVRGRARRRADETDGRSSANRRITKLARMWVAELGDVSVVDMISIRRVVELAVAAEELRGRILRGERTSDTALNSLVRLEGIADRAIRRLRSSSKREPKLTLMPHRGSE